MSAQAGVCPRANSLIRYLLRTIGYDAASADRCESLLRSFGRGGSGSHKAKGVLRAYPRLWIFCRRPLPLCPPSPRLAPETWRLNRWPNTANAAVPSGDVGHTPVGAYTAQQPSRLPTIHLSNATPSTHIPIAWTASINRPSCYEARRPISRPCFSSNSTTKTPH